MGKAHRRFGKEFEAEAVRLVETSGRIVKRTGDGSIIEFRSVVDAVNCAIEVQRAMVERNAGVTPDKRIELRIGVHLGDMVEEADGDLIGHGVNIAARLEGICAILGVVTVASEIDRPIFEFNANSLAVPVGDAIRVAGSDKVDLKSSLCCQTRKQEDDSQFILRGIVHWRAIRQSFGPGFGG